MALIKCPGCGKNIPDSYQTCPFCKKSFYDSGSIQEALDILFDEFRFNHSEKNKALINKKAKEIAEKIVLNNFSERYIASAKNAFNEFLSGVPLFMVDDPKLFIIENNAEVYLKDSRRVSVYTRYYKEYQTAYHTLNGNVLMGIKCKTDEDTTIIIPDGVTHISGKYIYEDTSRPDDSEVNYKWVIQSYCIDTPIKKVVIPLSLSCILNSAFARCVTLPIDCNHTIESNSSVIEINFLNEEAAISSKTLYLHSTWDATKHNLAKEYIDEYINGINLKNYYAGKDYHLKSESVFTYRMKKILSNCKNIFIDGEITIEGDEECVLPCNVYYCKRVSQYKLFGKITYFCCDTQVDEGLIFKEDLCFGGLNLVVSDIKYYFDFIQTSTRKYNHRVIINNQILTELQIPIWLSNYQIYNKDIAHIALADGITSIPDQAFAGCSNLEHIVIPNSVKSIGNYAFNGCSKLKELNFPKSIEKIDISTQLIYLDGVECISLPMPLEGLPNLRRCYELKTIETYTLISLDIIRKFENSELEYYKLDNYKISLCKKVESIFLLCPSDEALRQIEFLEKNKLFDLEGDINIYLNDGTSKTIKKVK